MCMESAITENRNYTGRAAAPINPAKRGFPEERDIMSQLAAGASP
jgi:hypothetical protein